MVNLQKAESVTDNLVERLSCVHVGTLAAKRWNMNIYVSSNSFRSTARVKTRNPAIRPPFLPAAERTDTQNRSWPVYDRAPCTTLRSRPLFSRHSTTGTRNYVNCLWCSPSTVPRSAVPICCCVPKERVITRNRCNYTRLSRSFRAATMAKAAGSGRTIRPID